MSPAVMFMSVIHLTTFFGFRPKTKLGLYCKILFYNFILIACYVEDTSVKTDSAEITLELLGVIMGC